MTDLCLHGLPIEEDCQKCNALIAQIATCDYCGDGIPKTHMDEHLSWCRPMIEKARADSLKHGLIFSNCNAIGLSCNGVILTFGNDLMDDQALGNNLANIIDSIPKENGT